MGKHLIEKTENIAAVQRQLGHTNAAYSIQYARVTDQKLADALDDR
jgi:site-specific recombinase XerC